MLWIFACLAATARGRDILRNQMLTGVPALWLLNINATRNVTLSKHASKQSTQILKDAKQSGWDPLFSSPSHSCDTELSHCQHKEHLLASSSKGSSPNHTKSQDFYSVTWKLRIRVQASVYKRYSTADYELWFLTTANLKVFKAERWPRYWKEHILFYQKLLASALPQRLPWEGWFGFVSYTCDESQTWQGHHFPLRF